MQMYVAMFCVDFIKAHTAYSSTDGEQWPEWATLLFYGQCADDLIQIVHKLMSYLEYY